MVFSNIVLTEMFRLLSFSNGQHEIAAEKIKKRYIVDKC